MSLYHTIYGAGMEDDFVFLLFPAEDVFGLGALKVGAFPFSNIPRVRHQRPNCRIRDMVGPQAFNPVPRTVFGADSEFQLAASPGSSPTSQALPRPLRCILRMHQVHAIAAH